MAICMVPTVPAVSPTLTEAKRQSATSLMVQWESLTLEESRGFLTSYQLIYFEALADCLQTRGNTSLESSRPLALVSGLDPQLSYCVAVAASTSAGQGNYSNMTFVPRKR